MHVALDLMSNSCSRWALLLAGVLALGVAGGYALAAVAQPHMEAALAALRNAAGELQQAEHDKGGHREKAMQLVEQAMRQVEAGVTAANQ
jgi:hypothetical protein